MTEKIILIGLDAAEPEWIERMMDAGELPALSKLRKQGAYSRVGRVEDRFIELPWVTFYTGVDQGHHGVYHHQQWVSEDQNYRRVNRSWLDMIPFWEHAAFQDKRIICVDVPHTPSSRELPGQVEINGYGSYEYLEGVRYIPRGLKRELTAKGITRIPLVERYEPHTRAEKAAMLPVLQAQTERMAELGVHLLDNHLWDVFIIVFAAPHRGGHRFWDDSNVMPDDPERELGGPSHDLLAIYKKCDNALGRMLAHLPDDVTTVVFSLHGMGPNTSRTAAMEALLGKILGESGETPPPHDPTPGSQAGIFSIIPSDLRYRIKNALPVPLQEKLTFFLQSRNKNWETIRAFAPMSDYFGAVQINLKGREKHGIVEPGEEYDTLLATIKSGFLSFRDSDTGEPIVSRILEKHELGTHGENLHRFPDLVIHWAPTPAADFRAADSPRYGRVFWPMPGVNPNGRSGNHRNQGFVLISGGSLQPSAQLNEVSIVDFAPTIFKTIGLDVPNTFAGKPFSTENKP